MKKILLTCVVFMLISGCQQLVVTPQEKVGILTLYDKKNGSKWVGTFKGYRGASSGEASITIERDFYQGDWMGVKAGGGASQFSNGININYAANGTGQVHLNSDNGRFITCDIVANSMSRTGMGECKRNDGRVYDLFMKVN